MRATHIQDREAIWNALRGVHAMWNAKLRGDFYLAVSTSENDSTVLNKLKDIHLKPKPTSKVAA